MLKAGIVGLPNVGKSTLFNAVTRTRKAEAANYPFCTIDPNVGIVTVPDARLQVLQEIAKTKVVIPAASPFIFTGLRVGIGRAVNAMITAELFFAAVNLGKILKSSGNAFDTAALFAVILVVSLFGLACQEGMRFIERLVIPWHHGRET